MKLKMYVKTKQTFYTWPDLKKLTTYEILDTGPIKKLTTSQFKKLVREKNTQKSLEQTQ